MKWKEAFIGHRKNLAMMEDLVAQEEEHLGVGNEDFLRRHREIMELIGAAERAQEERRN